MNNANNNHRDISYLEKEVNALKNHIEHQLLKLDKLQLYIEELERALGVHFDVGVRLMDKLEMISRILFVLTTLPYLINFIQYIVSIIT